MCKGLPASGKTTWAKVQVQNRLGVKRVSKDDLRLLLDNGIHTRTNEKLILLIRDSIVMRVLNEGLTIIVDDTNFAPKHEQRLRELAKNFDAEFEIQDFTHISLDACLERDRNRTKRVGEEVIRKMYNQYLAPSLQKSATMSAFADIQDKSLPKAIICDLDGTLCHLNGRDPYNASTCGNDQVNEPILEIVKKFSETHRVIFMSGRSSDYKKETTNWIIEHVPNFFGTTERFVPFSLRMRVSGDTRKDSIIKQELYDTYIKGRYYVDFVLDDRQQVVDMWRANGLTCLQVAPGNF